MTERLRAALERIEQAVAGEPDEPPMALIRMILREALASPPAEQPGGECPGLDIGEINESGEWVPPEASEQPYHCPCCPSARSAETGKCQHGTAERYCNTCWPLGGKPPSGAAKADEASIAGRPAKQAPVPEASPNAAAKPDGDEPCPLPPRVAHARHWWGRDDGLQVWCPGRPPAPPREGVR